MKGYFYLQGNTPVIAAERKPEEKSFHNSSPDSIEELRMGAFDYELALEEWESQLVEAENVESEDMGSEGIVHFLRIGKWQGIITPGQAIEYEGNVITKTL